MRKSIFVVLCLFTLLLTSSALQAQTLSEVFKAQLSELQEIESGYSGIYAKRNLLKASAAFKVMDPSLSDELCQLAKVFEDEDQCFSGGTKNENGVLISKYLYGLSKKYAGEQRNLLYSAAVGFTRFDRACDTLCEIEEICECEVSNLLAKRKRSFASFLNQTYLPLKQLAERLSEDEAWEYSPHAFDSKEDLKRRKDLWWSDHGKDLFGVKDATESQSLIDLYYSCFCIHFEECSECYVASNQQ